jgi:hypothetical protein
MIYGGPGFLAPLGLSPPPFSRQQFVSLAQCSCASPVELTDRIGGEGEEPNHTVTTDEEVWSSMDHSILSEPV